MRSTGLGRLIPRWKGDRVDMLRVTGDSGKDMDGWRHSPHEPTEFELKLILGLIMEVGILISMGSHCYEFAGRFYLQLLGGPIGLAVTAWIASITMQCFDNLWTKLLADNKIECLTYVRYVDDARDFTRGLKKGVRWKNGSFSFNKNWEIEDQNSDVSDDVTIMNLLLEAKNSVMPFLKFTGEAPSQFSDG